MSKILIPLNNSTWGVIVHPVAPNEYEHVLSFENEEVKKQYIGKELFNNVDFDYISAIDQMESRSFIKTNELEGEVTIDIDALNNNALGLEYTIQDLENIDSMFIKEGDQINLYAVNSVDRTTEQNNQSFIFNVTMDVMFNSIDSIELEGQCKMDRGMVDRFKNNDGNVLWNSNDFRNKTKENFISTLSKKFYYNIKREKSQLKFGDEVPDDIKEEFTNCQWLVIYTVNDRDGDSMSFIGNMSSPFTPWIFPIVDTEIYIKLGDPVNYVRYTADDFLEDMHSIDGDNLIIAASITDEPPAGTISYDVDKYLFTADQPVFNAAWWMRGFSDTPKAGGVIVREVDKVKYTGIAKTDTLPPISIESLSFENKKEIYNEIKYWTEFQNVTIQDKSNSWEIDLQLIEDHQLSFDLDFSFAPTQESIVLSVDQGEYEGSKNNFNVFMINRNSEIEVISDSMSEFVLNNKYSRFTSLLSSGTGVAGSVAIALSEGGLNPIADLAALHSVNSFRNQVAQRKDLAAAPETISGGSGGYIDKMYGIVDFIINRNKLIDSDMQMGYNYIYTFGNTLNIIDDPKNYMNTRYYFNYIKGGNVFSLIKNRWSANRKQIINDAFQTGFTIWHVRDVETFKGIANYEYENQEIVLLN